MAAQRPHLAVRLLSRLADAFPYGVGCRNIVRTRFASVGR